MKNALFISLLLITYNCFGQDCNPEFVFEKDEYCSNEGVILPIHDNGGIDGIYTYVTLSGGTMTLDSLTGEINLTTSETGIYEITNTLETTTCSSNMTQGIEITADTTPPFIELDNFSDFINPSSCLGDLYIPNPIITDDSGEMLDFTLAGPDNITLLSPNTSTNPTNEYQVFGLEAGIHTFTVSAIDECGNSAQHEFTITINLPSAIVSPISSSTVYIQREDHIVQVKAIDEGSINYPCLPSKIELRRINDACNIDGNETFNNDGHLEDSNTDIDDGAYISICINDLNDIDDSGEEYGIVELKLRGWIDNNLSEYFGDALDLNGDGDSIDIGEYDNYSDNFHSLEVRKHPLFGSITCPDDITINCDQDYTDLNITGQIIVPDTVDINDIEITYQPMLNACYVGEIEASFNYQNILTCTQIITTINPYPAFDPSGIVMPEDTTYTDCTVQFQPPTWITGVCDFIGFTEDVDTLEFITMSNYTLIREITVIDWCLYDATNGEEGLYFGTHEITVKDETPPVANCIYNISFYPSELPIELSANSFNNGTYDNCTESGDIRYSYAFILPNQDPEFVDSINTSLKTITVDDFQNGTLGLEIYTWDLANFTNKCNVVISLKDECLEPNYHIVDPRNQWNVTHFDFLGNISTSKQRFNSDSILIEGEYYHQLQTEENEFGENWVDFPLYMRECNGQVLGRKNGNEEKLYFDFNLEVGDTLLRSQYVGNIDLIVNDISEKNYLDGSTRKVIGLKMVDDIGYFRIVEGIGSFQFPLSDFESITINDYPVSITCFSTDDQLVAMASEISSCWLVTSVEDQVLDTIILSPNPTTGLIQLSADQAGILTLYGITGTRLKSVNITKGINNINISDIGSGVIIYNLTVGGEMQTGKLIKT